MKFFIPKVLFFFISFFCAFSVYGFDFEADGLWYNLKKNGDNVILVGSRYREGKLIIPDTVYFRNREFTITGIKEGSFYGHQFSYVSIPGSIKYISNRAFDNASIRELHLSEGIASIGVSSFESNNFTTITIPNSVTRIEDCAFRSCKELKTINIGDNLEYIHWGAFDKCENIGAINCFSLNPPQVYVTEIENYGKPIFVNMVYQFATLKVPAISVGKYRASDLWSNFKSILPLTDEPLTQFQQLAVEWDMLKESNMITPWDRYEDYNLFGEYKGSFSAYTFTESLDKKGKVKIKRTGRCQPIGKMSDHRGFEYPFIVLAKHSENYLTLKFMLHGNIQLYPGGDYEEFYTLPIEPAKDKEIIFEGVTSTDKHFRMSIYRELGEHHRIEPINNEGGRTPCISVLPDAAEVKIEYTAPDSTTYRSMVALKYIPTVYVIDK